ncbi:MAG: hypothetical protein GY938_02870 [Ketobacter sp.]|nr:hypothetical protein [Ketobacter sp.]
MRSALILLLSSVLSLGLIGCGGDLDDRGMVSIEILGNGSASVTGTDIDCPETCQREVVFTQLEVNSIANNSRTITVQANVDPDSELLGWLPTGRTFISNDTTVCESDPICQVRMQEICAVGHYLPGACAANAINDIELRPVVMNTNSLIDWDRSGGYICVLQQPGEAQCWQSSAARYRNFEHTNTPSLINPTQVSVASNFGCALDQTGVHCWSSEPDAIIAEPSILFGLSHVEQISVRIGYYGCALADGDVTCWQRKALAVTPSLNDPTNLRREGNSTCVDDGTEKVCWSFTAGEYIESRQPLIPTT